MGNSRISYERTLRPMPLPTLQPNSPPGGDSDTEPVTEGGSEESVQRWGASTWAAEDWTDEEEWGADERDDSAELHPAARLPGATALAPSQPSAVASLSATGSQPLARRPSGMRGLAVERAIAERMLRRVVLGRYLVEALVEQSQQRVTLKGTDISTDKPVLLQAFPARTLAGPASQALGWLSRCAGLSRTAAPLVALSEEEEGCLCVFEARADRSLASTLALGPLATRTVVRLALDVAQALQATHDKGITHGAIREEQVWLYDGPHGLRAEVLAFGLEPLWGSTDPDSGVFRLPGARRETPLEPSEDGEDYGVPLDPSGMHADVRAFGHMLRRMVGGAEPLANETAAAARLRRLVDGLGQLCERAWPPNAKTVHAALHRLHETAQSAELEQKPVVRSEVVVVGPTLPPARRPPMAVEPKVIVSES